MGPHRGREAGHLGKGKAKEGSTHTRTHRCAHTQGGTEGSHLGMEARNWKWDALCAGWLPNVSETNTDQGERLFLSTKKIHELKFHISVSL